MEPSAYLIGTLLFGALFWLPLFVFRPALRRPMLIFSFLALPLGPLTLYFFHTDYWTTQYVFGLWLPIEEALFSFFAAGACGAIYRTFFELPDLAIKNKSRWALGFFVVGTALMVLAHLSGVLSIHASTLILCAFAGALVFVRPHLFRPACVGAVFGFFSLLIVYALLVELFPSIVTLWWIRDGILGPTLLGIPIEEFMWGAAWGLFAAPAFELVVSSRYSR